MAIPVWHRLRIDLQDHVAGALPFHLYFRRNVCEDAVDPGLEQSAEVVRHVAEAQFEIAPSGSLKQTTPVWRRQDAGRRVHHL
jgi:hypothetical protein